MVGGTIDAVRMPVTPAIVLDALSELRELKHGLPLPYNSHDKKDRQPGRCVDVVLSTHVAGLTARPGGGSIRGSGSSVLLRIASLEVMAALSCHHPLPHSVGTPPGMH